MKIMIVEDDPVSLALLKKTLLKTVPSIIIAKNGAEAWERFTADQPRIVITDWMLPELSGIDLCCKIRASQAPVYSYVIIMTSKDRKEDVLTAFEAGADDYVAKPFDVRELQARINTGKRIMELEDNHQAMQQTLINSRNKIRTVFDALPEEIISVDKQLRLASINKAALETMQGSYDELIGQPCCYKSGEIGTCFYDNNMEEMVANGFATRTLETLLDRHQNEDGQEVIKERTSIPVIDESGDVQSITIISRDITEAHRRNEEIRDLNRKLKKISSELIKKNVKLESTLGNLEKTQTECRVVLQDYTGTERILVVDDITEQLDIAVRMLSKLGYRVESASGGKEAVAYMQTHTVDLLVLDMVMPPGIDGLETYQRILERHPGQKSIIASGYAESGRVKAMQDLGAGEYIRKPYTLEKIGLAVRRELDRKTSPACPNHH